VTSPLLEIDDLGVNFPNGRETAVALEDVSLTLARGETLAVVGESGSGKTSLALSLMGLLPATARCRGRALWRGKDLLAMEERRLRKVRGVEIGIVFQDARSALNPFLRISTQMTELLRRRLGHGKREAEDRAIAMLEKAGIAGARERIRDYPAEFSGGMRQRALLAMALCANPLLLIADEVTSAVDETTQIQIVDLLREWQAESGGAILLITHDLGVAARLAHRVLVLHGGRVMEAAAADSLFQRAECAYSRVLLRAATGAFESMRGFQGSRQGNAVGCTFAGKCPDAAAECFEQTPPLSRIGETHWVRCWNR